MKSATKPPVEESPAAHQSEGGAYQRKSIPVVVIKKLGTPIKTTSGVKRPWGVAVNQRGEIIVGEGYADCISIFSETGEKLRSFG